MQEIAVGGVHLQRIAAPDSAKVLMCVKCQSLASPFTAEYWHIGATIMRLGRARPRSFIGENRALMGDVRLRERVGCFYLAMPRSFLNRADRGRSAGSNSLHQCELQQQRALER